MLKIEHLTKRYRDAVAVDDLHFEVRPGVVTGFLGPNGSGKSTTMRLVMGLDHATSGRATINGQKYADLKCPLREVGALLDARAVHPGRTARNHLRALAASNRIRPSRIDEVLEVTGITSVANKKVGSYSLGMSQRLGIAAALLGDPAVLLFDEPVNGLDPEGIRWIRDLFRQLAGDGRTVFVSSHLMSEMALAADHVVVIGRGKFIREGSMAELTASAGGSVFVRASDNAALTIEIVRRGGEVTQLNGGAMSVAGLSSDDVGRAGFDAGLTIWELTPRRASLEDVFMDLTADAVQYPSAPTSPAPT